MKKLGIVNTEQIVLKKLIHNISFFRIVFFRKKFNDIYFRRIEPHFSHEFLKD